jgi:2-polyprenyl-6-methoxyphenol hydroxylase-like FAD-dependent oxidoreductase
VPAMADEHVPILIVGGSLVGLTTAMLRALATALAR